MCSAGTVYLCRVHAALASLFAPGGRMWCGPAADFEKTMSIDRVAWLAEVEQHRILFQKLEERLPAQRTAVNSRLCRTLEI